MHAYCLITIYIPLGYGVHEIKAIVHCQKPQIKESSTDLMDNTDFQRSE